MIAQNKEEQPHAQRAQAQHAKHHFAQGAPPRNAGHENTDEGAVGNPPCPIEDRPVTDKTGISDGVRPEGHRQRVLEQVPH